MFHGSISSGFLPERHWKMVLQSMPIPCVDVIIDRDSKVLLGFRTIPPYRNVWALPGGRIHKHEHPRDTAERMLKEIGVSAVLKDFIGVFPVRFSRDPKGRYDITLCYSYRWKTGEPTSTPELVRLKWFPPHRLPKRTGGNYRKMIQAAFSPQHDD